MAATRIELEKRGPSIQALIKQEEKEASSALRDAMRNTARRAEKIVSRQIRKYLALPKTVVDKAISSYYDPQADHAVVRVENRSFPLSLFKHSQAYKAGRYKSTGLRRKGGFKVRIWKGKKPTHLKHAFYFKGNIAERKGKPRFPIRILKGPALGNVFLWRSEEIDPDVDSAFGKEWDRAIKRKARGY